MSNRVYVEAYPEKDGFTDVKIADDYAKTVVSFEGNLPDSDIDLLKELRKLAKGEENEQAMDILDFVEENQKGVTIRDTYYSFEEVMPAFASEAELVVNIPYNVQLHDRWVEKLKEITGVEPNNINNIGESDDITFSIPEKNFTEIKDKVAELDFVLGVFEN